jgi:predicted aspartyl protease
MVASEPKIVKRTPRPILGRVDEWGKVLMPLCITAADGFELEIEALINLQFGGALFLPESLVTAVGWRRLGARRVLNGDQVCVVNQYLGVAALVGMTPESMVVLAGSQEAVIGQKLLKGHKLSIDFATGQVILE